MTDGFERQPATDPEDIETTGTTQIIPGTQGHTEPAETAAAEGQAGAGHSGGMPGDGAGRRDEIGGESGVHRLEDVAAGDDLPIRMAGGWGQGERGGEAYQDAGTSEGSTAGTAQELLED